MSRPQALLHYTFAALSGDVPASMTVGYRYWAGIGTKQSCKDALGWYKSAADAALAEAEERVKEATKLAQSQDIVDIIVSEPIAIRIHPTEIE